MFIQLQQSIGRLLVAYVVLSTALWGTAVAQPPPQPFPVLSQTVDGVTVRITDARWAKPEEVFPFTWHRDSYDKGFAFRYDIQTRDPRVQPVKGKTLVNYIDSMRVFDPLGQRITSSSSCGLGSAYWEGVDPRWDSVKVEMEFRDPAAPAEARGTFEETLEFKDVPVPAKDNSPIAVDRSLLTALGTQVILEKVSVRTVEQGDRRQGEILFMLKYDPPKQARDLRVQFGINPGDLKDDQGTDFTPAAHGGGDYISRQQTLSVFALPSPKAKTFSVKVRVLECAPSLKQWKWFRTFRFDLNLRQVKYKANKPSPKPLAIAAAGSVDVILESMSRQASNYQARLWVRKRDKQRDINSEWRLRSAPMHIDADWENHIGWEMRKLFWKTDGTPAHENESGVERAYPFSDTERKPTRLTLEAEVEEVRRSRHIVDFKDVPVPKPGEIMEMEKRGLPATGARLVLRKVGHFTQKHPRPLWEVSGCDTFPPTIGLALVFECKPVAEMNSETNFRCIMASDGHGHPPDMLCGGSYDVLRGTWTPGKWWSVVLLPPSPGAKSLTVRMRVEEVIPTGRKETVVFRDLPMPALAP